MRLLGHAVRCVYTRTVELGALTLTPAAGCCSSAAKLRSLIPPVGAALSVPFMNLFNVVFFLPFFAGFIYDPNALFGPNSTLNPMPMFTVPLGETALWFSKAWSTAAVVIVLGPYLFACPATKVVKQMAFVYLTSTALFAYALVEYVPPHAATLLLSPPPSDASRSSFLLLLPSRSSLLAPRSSLLALLPCQVLDLRAADHVRPRRP